MCVRVVRPAVHGDWIHGERRPEHVPVSAGDREHADARQQYPFSQVSIPYTLFVHFNHTFQSDKCNFWSKQQGVTCIDLKSSPPPLSIPSFSILHLLPSPAFFSLSAVYQTSSTCRCRSRQGWSTWRLWTSCTATWPPGTACWTAASLSRSPTLGWAETCTAATTTASRAGRCCPYDGWPGRASCWWGRGGVHNHLITLSTLSNEIPAGQVHHRPSLMLMPTNTNICQYLTLILRVCGAG